MSKSPTAFVVALSLALICLISFQSAGAAEKGVWTDPNDPTISADFRLQGEFAGDKIGCQVIALGNDAFQAVVLPGGLPGAGWDGKKKIILDGKIDGTKVALASPKGNKKYLAQSPAEFSATSKFPPVGQKDYSGTIEEGVLTLKTDEGQTLSLKRTVRESSALGAKAPAEAIVLFDGTSTSEWNGGRVDEKTKLLNTDGKDITTKRKFSNYTAHVEFYLPFKPEGRGQGRGNSGFYQVHHYEVQILDSFGLDGKNNECGGVYTKLEPSVNMCLPPLQWQSYDIDFTNAVMESGKKTKNAHITAKHNGVSIHEDAEITGPTGGHRGDAEGTPGPLVLQGHGNPLQFRNIWVVEKK